MKTDKCNYKLRYIFTDMNSSSQSSNQTGIWNKKSNLVYGCSLMIMLMLPVQIAWNNNRHSKQLKTKTKMKAYFHSHCGICGAMIHFIYNTTCPRSYFFYLFQIFYCERMFLEIKKSSKFAFPPNTVAEYPSSTQISPMFLSYRNQ